MKVHANIIIDFDSTLVSCETLDVLAEKLLSPAKQRQVQKLTEDGMKGLISYRQSLKGRFELMSFTKSEMDTLKPLLVSSISKSALQNRAFFQANAANIYIVSGGFKEPIKPVAKELGLLKEHIYANECIFDAAEKMVGFDTTNPLSHDNGKIDVVKNLQLEGPTIVIGDGYTDYQVRQSGYAEEFIAYTEHANREAVVQYADLVVSSFDECITQLLKDY